MATAPKNPASSGAMMSFMQNLLHTGLYKRNQGQIARQATFAAIAVAVLLGSYRLYTEADPAKLIYQYSVPSIVLFVGLWIAYRLVNLSSFADFLISVEAEMSKVSWPTKTELVRGSVVVLITILFLAAFLFGFDLIWTFVFKHLGIVR